MSSGDPPEVETAEDVRLRGPDLALPDELIERILRGEPIDAAAAPDARLLAAFVATLQRAGQPGELGGQAAAVAAYRWALKNRASRAHARRRTRPSVRAGIAGAAVVGALGAGAVVAAATGSLPAPLQTVAHVLFGAPPPAEHPGGDESPAGAEATEPSTDKLTPIPSPSPRVGISAPAAPPTPMSGQSGSSPGAIAVGPAEPEANGALGPQTGTLFAEGPAASPATHPDSAPSTPSASPSGSSPANAKPKGAPPAHPEPAGGPPADVEPKGAPPAPVEPRATPPERPEPPEVPAPPANVEPKAGPPADVARAGNPPAPAVELPADPTEVVEQPG
jgi:hypothetical protein